MVHYTSELLGVLKIRQGENCFKIEIRRGGNCLAVLIHVRKMVEGEPGYKKGLYMHSLYVFYNNEEHIKRCIKEYGDMLDDEVVSVRLNTYYKESFVLARYMTRCGHKVTLYYKEPKETKSKTKK